MYVFVADIHIRPGITGDSRRFISWLTAIKNQASAIYILGDLFDYFYTGLESRTKDVLDALQSPQVHLMTGNRDFLLKNTRINTINIIQAEEQLITLFDQEVLIAHGHTLTEADRGFKILHKYGWPILAGIDRFLPTKIKDVLARFLVNSSAAIRPLSTRIDKDIAQRRGVHTVVCGHLHKALMDRGLIVLPAFLDTGQWLAWDADGPRLVGMNEVSG